MAKTPTIKVFLGGIEEEEKERRHFKAYMLARKLADQDKRDKVVINIDAVQREAPETAEDGIELVYE